MKGLDQLRQEIDTVNDELISLLKKRFHVVDELLDVKKQNKMQLHDADREKIQLERIVKMAKKEGLDEELIMRIFVEIFKVTLEYQEKHYS